MPIELMIGNRIRKFRKARRLKLEELAQASRISKALLSKIETAKVSSPISTYSRIARALGLPLGELFREEETKGNCVVIRKNGGKPISGGQTTHGYQFESLGYKWPNTDFNPFLISYLPHAKNPSFPNFTFEGDEFIFLLEGEIQMHYGGAIHRITPGDCIFLDGRVPHGGCAVGGKKAVALLISIPAKMSV